MKFAFSSILFANRSHGFGSDDLSRGDRYDELNNLTGVSQSSSRPRSFVYDSLSRLTFSTNPETGTATFTYDADGNVVSKVSPAVNQTNPRVTQTVSYQYDVSGNLVVYNAVQNTNLTLVGAITNTGQIIMNPGLDTFIDINGKVTLKGKGTLTMNPGGFIVGIGTAPVLTNASTIQGAGNIGNGSMGLINTGTILANQTTYPLTTGEVRNNPRK
jgi:YD repeat-containing protein